MMIPAVQSMLHTSLLQSLRYSLRRLRRQPSFAILAVLVLAIGIGPTTAVYAVFRQVLLRQLPVHKPGDLVLLQEHSAYETGSFSSWGGGPENYFAYPALPALRRVMPSLAAAAIAPATLVTNQAADRVTALLITGNYFGVLAQRPVLGRLIEPTDDTLHAGNSVVVLSEAYWRSHLGADPSVLNRSVALNGTPFTVVGVAAHTGIMDAQPADLFLPLSMHQAVSVGDATTLADPLSRFLFFVGRLQDGQTRASVAPALNTAWYNWRLDALQARSHNIGDAKGWMQTHLTVAPGARGLSLLQLQFGTPIIALQVMTVLVLLVACTNLANLLLARGAARRGEMAVRLALGSGRTALVLATATDALVIGCFGTALGLIFGWLCLRLLAHTLAADSTTGMALQAPWHWTVVCFAALAGLLTSVLFSVAPALAAGRVQPGESLRQQADAHRGTHTFQNTLASSAVALSLLLLVASILFGWNLYQQSTAHLGFETDHLLSFRVDESGLGANPSVANQIYQDIHASLSVHSSVTNATYAVDGLLSGRGSDSNLTIEGRPDTASDPLVNHDLVGPAFLRTLRIPLLAGKDLNNQDEGETGNVAIVNQAFVHTFFHGDAGKAIGAHFGFGQHTHMAFEDRIVGIIPDIYQSDLSHSPTTPLLYMPFSQSLATHHLAARSAPPATFYIRTSGDPSALAQDVRSIVHRIDPKLPILDMQTMQQLVAADIADTRLLFTLSVALGGLAALLAAVGLYGVLACQVARRTREIGIRMAVGATRANVIVLVLLQTLRLAAVGLAGGGVLAFFASRALHAQTAALSPAPPWLYAAMAVLLLLCALAAGVLPARRAAHVDPMEALRTE